MKFSGKIFWCVATAIFCIVAGRNLAQSLPPIGHAEGFLTDIYYEPPNDQKIKARLSGAEALPATGGLLEVKHFQMESFQTNGNPRIVAQAATCTIDYFEKTAYSPSHLTVVSGDGNVRVDSDGFQIVWQTNAMSLRLSNNVHAVFETQLLKQ